MTQESAKGDVWVIALMAVFAGAFEILRLWMSAH